jgi:hypothetical protein
VRLEGLVQLNNPMTSSGIEPANFRLVASFHIHIKIEIILNFVEKDSILVIIVFVQLR